MSLGGRVYGPEFSEIEREFVFERADAGFVRYNLSLKDPSFSITFDSP